MSKSIDGRLVSFGQRVRYAMIPQKVYSWYRANRDLRRYEPELHILRHLVDPSRSSVDAGANRGSYTYHLSRQTKEVFAYEPNPAMRQILKRSVRSNVTVRDAALSDHNGRATFSVPLTETGARNNAGSLESNSQMDGQILRFEVPVRRLDDENLPPIGFIKIDVEGHEHALLEGARGILARDRPVLLVEIMDGLMDHGTWQSIQRIEAFGYRAHALVGLQIIDARMLDQLADPGEGFDRNRPQHRSNNFIFLPTGRAANAA